MMHVYVAASSTELDRARRWMNALRAEGIVVTSDWVEEIQKVGEANPREAPASQRYSWSSKDLANVARADVVWMLTPVEGSGRGAYYELGYAQALGLELVFSGDTKQSIFCAQGQEFSRDDGAFEYVLWLARHESGLP